MSFKKDDRWIVIAASVTIVIGIVILALILFLGAINPSGEFSVNTQVTSATQTTALPFESRYFSDRKSAIEVSRGVPRTTIAPRPSSTTTTSTTQVIETTTSVVIVPTTVEPELVDGIPALLRRIGGCESVGRPDGELVWTAQNRRSSASGAFQYLRTTWNNFKGYAAAKFAPASVQIERAVSDFYLWQKRGGGGPWAQSRHCWG